MDGPVGEHVGVVAVPFPLGPFAAAGDPALPVELGGLRLVEDDVGGPPPRGGDDGGGASAIGGSADTTVEAVAASAVRVGPTRVGADPGGVDVQCPRAVREHVRRDRAGEGLAGDDDGLVCRLQGGP